MAHSCHALNCSTNVPPQMFMCKRHWFKVPYKMRVMIWATYRAGQCDDWNPSAEYCTAAKNAIVAVAEKEGVAITGGEDKLKLYDLFSNKQSAELLRTIGGKPEAPHGK